MRISVIYSTLSVSCKRVVSVLSPLASNSCGGSHIVNRTYQILTLTEQNKDLVENSLLKCIFRTEMSINYLTASEKIPHNFLALTY